jgi:hypothetical protein
VRPYSASLIFFWKSLRKWHTWQLCKTLWLRATREKPSSHLFVLLKGGDRTQLPSSSYLHDSALDATYTPQGAAAMTRARIRRKKYHITGAPHYSENFGLPIFESLFFVEVPCSSNSRCVNRSSKPGPLFFFSFFIPPYTYPSKSRRVSVEREVDDVCIDKYLP